MSSTTLNWLENQENAERSHFTRALAISFAGHVLLALALTISPRSSVPSVRNVITARLVQMPPGANPGRGASLDAPSPKAKPAPAAPAPAPTPKKVLLPKQAPAAQRKIKQVQRRPKPEELGYSDALAALRAEMGEEESTAPDGELARDDVTDTGTQSAQTGVLVSPELAAWMNATQAHIRREWIMPSEFLTRSLTTEVMVNLAANGEVMGTPRVVRSSGDPYWDDNTVRALMRASPLPAPPESGEWPFVFSPQ